MAYFKMKPGSKEKNTSGGTSEKQTSIAKKLFKKPFIDAPRYKKGVCYRNCSKDWLTHKKISHYGLTKEQYGRKVKKAGRGRN